MLKKASTWSSSGVSMFVFRPRLFRWVVWQYHKLTITSTSASIIPKPQVDSPRQRSFFIVCSENRHVTTPAKNTTKRCCSKNLRWLYSTHPRIRVSCLVWRSDRKAGEVARIVLPPPPCYASACEKTIWLPYTTDQSGRSVNLRTPSCHGKKARCGDAIVRVVSRSISAKNLPKWTSCRSSRSWAESRITIDRLLRCFRSRRNGACKPDEQFQSNGRKLFLRSPRRNGKVNASFIENRR